MHYTIEAGDVADWKEATDLTSKNVQWELSYNDLEVYWKAYGKDNVIFLVARNEDRQFCGCALLGKAKGNISTIAMYFVMPELQGTGIGNAIFAKLTESSIKEGRNIGMNAAKKMSEKYTTRLGYDKFPKWRIELISFTEVNVDYVREHMNDGCKIVNLNEVDFAKLVEYDSKVAAGYDRSGFVKAWTEHPDGYTKVALNSAGAVIGYGTARLVTNDNIVYSPLYANDDATAKQLILTMFNHDNQLAVRTGFFFSITTTVGRLSKIVSEFAKVQDVTYIISQFTKEAPPADSEKVYSISDIALGFI
uniref:N-acetyltransferase domain-containing protein n=1 Tax=Plectus sambesii TaxID=2011161 RepID=A0A914XKG7_9BILA